MTASLPNPFVSDPVNSSPPPKSPLDAGAEEKAAAVVGDAPAVAARFTPDMNRLYLDIVSMPQPPLHEWWKERERMPLFLNMPAPDPVLERKVARNFVEALIDCARRE